MQKISLIFLLLIYGCATSTGEVGSIITEPAKVSVLNKDARYQMSGTGCMANDHFSPVVSSMVHEYNRINPEKYKAYGMSNITYEHYLIFFIPCLKLKGTPLIKETIKEKKSVGEK